MSFLKNLPYPDVIEELNYDELLKGVKELFKSYLTDKEISLLESDNYSALLETLAYRELLLRARINSSVKAMLLPFSSGSDLDNIVAIYGIERLKGEKPTAGIELSLSTPRDADTIIPAGSVLVSDNGDVAYVKETAIVKKGELKTTAVSVLDKFIKSSPLKCEYIQTPFPFVLKAKQLSDFSGGAEVESDERLRERAVLSLERFSTAGVVQIYLKSLDMSEDTRASVAEYLSGEKVRPFTDKVVVKNARIKDIEIKATLELTDMFLQDIIDKEIKASRKSLKLGEDLNLSYIYSMLHKNGVYRVNLAAPTADTKVDEDSFARISFNLSYAKAEL